MRTHPIDATENAHEMLIAEAYQLAGITEHEMTPEVIGACRSHAKMVLALLPAE